MKTKIFGFAVGGLGIVLLLVVAMLAFYVPAPGGSDGVAPGANSGATQNPITKVWSYQIIVDTTNYIPSSTDATGLCAIQDSSVRVGSVSYTLNALFDPREPYKCTLKTELMSPPSQQRIVDFDTNLLNNKWVESVVQQKQVTLSNIPDGSYMLIVSMRDDNNRIVSTKTHYLKLANGALS